MHIETQVALNFVISYLYNKLPRRRVNIFGEELEKALKDKFQGHWYPEKPFKGSAFRCLKTGDPIDQVLERAARESGVPIADILENLPNELSVWIDPGEVSYRIGEKGAVKILYSESNDAHEESSADREVTKTFNPEAQCFRPIEIVSTSLSNLSLSPKIAVNQETPPTFQASPMYNPTTAPKNGLISPAVAVVQPPVAATQANGGNSASFLNRSQEPLTFTTATFAQTKFGSTKLKNSSKRTNRMSPTEFSNYLKQRAMQQQLHPPGIGFGGTISPSRSISPNSLGMGGNVDPYYFGMNMYPTSTFGGSPKNLFDNQSFATAAANQSSAEQMLYGNVKCSSLDAQSFNNIIPPQNGASVNGTPNTNTGNNGNANQNSNGMNNNPYQHLLVAN